MSLGHAEAKLRLCALLHKAQLDHAGRKIRWQRMRPERTPLKPLALDPRSLALVDGESAIEKLRARIAELHAIEREQQPPEAS